jgi:predicted DNA-binding transcriptional regulator AlpA
MADMKKAVGELLVIGEVTDRLKVSKWTLANWRRGGFGPPYVRLKGSDIRYPEDGLHKWIEERTVNSLAEEREGGKEFPGSSAGGFGAPRRDSSK